MSFGVTPQNDGERTIFASSVLVQGLEENEHQGQVEMCLSYASLACLLVDWLGRASLRSDAWRS